MEFSYTGGVAFKQSVEEFINKNPKELDKFHDFIKSHAGLISRAEGQYLPKLRKRLIQIGGFNHPVLETIDCIQKRLLGPTLAELPQGVLLEILKLLTLKELKSISLVNKGFNQLAHDHTIIAAFLEEKTHTIPLVKKLEMAKYAGPHLINLDLTCSNITDEQLWKVLVACSNIKSLYLSDCSKITNSALDKLPQGLQSLNLSFCKKITNAALDKLPQGLQSLDLSHCENITNSTIDKLPKGLQALDLSFCKKITDAALDKLPQGLRSLNLSYCKNLTDAALDKLPQGLQLLYLYDCNNITDAALDKLLKGLQSLRVFEGYTRWN